MRTADDLEVEPPALAPARPWRLVGVLAGSAAIVAVVGLWYLSSGAPNLSIQETLDAIAARGSAGFNVVWDLRVPRLLLALLSGALLGLAGTVLQDALRNPLADPALLGISESVAVIVALTILFPGVLPPVATPILCLAAGMATGAIVVLMARSIRDPVRLILVGVIISGLIATVTTVVILLAPVTSSFAGQMQQFLVFTTGSVATATWDRLAIVAPWAVLAVPFALAAGRTLNLLQLGDDIASGLGMRVTRARLALFAVAVLLIAPSASVTGPIAFVALLSPHIARFLLRTTNAFLVLPASAAIGAVIVLLADAAGRLLFFPMELPAGIWTIVIGGPVAIYLAGPRLRASAAVAPA